MSNWPEELGKHQRTPRLSEFLSLSFGQRGTLGNAKGGGLPAHTRIRPDSQSAAATASRRPCPVAGAGREVLQVESYAGWEEGHGREVEGYQPDTNGLGGVT